MTNNDKHSILLQYEIEYNRKMFSRTVANVINFLGTTYATIGKSSVKNYVDVEFVGVVNISNFTFNEVTVAKTSFPNCLSDCCDLIKSDFSILYNFLACQHIIA